MSENGTGNNYRGEDGMDEGYRDNSSVNESLDWGEGKREGENGEEDNIFDWLYGVLARPVSTLNEIARKKPVGLALLVFFGVTVLSMAAGFLSDESMRAFEEMLSEFDLLIAPSVLVIGTILFSLVYTFISTGLLHLLARLFGGRGGYWNLFCAYCFAYFPMIISIPFTLLSAFLGPVGGFLSGVVTFGLTIWIIVLYVIAVRESHGISTGASVGVYIIQLVVLVVIPVAIAVAMVVALIFI